MAVIHAFDKFLVYSANSTVKFEESAIQIFEWKDTLISVDDIKVSEITLRDYSAVKL